MTLKTWKLITCFPKSLQLKMGGTMFMHSVAWLIFTILSLVCQNNVDEHFPVVNVSCVLGMSAHVDLSAIAIQGAVKITFT